ncbi:hypothetical protein [Aporhodopirellula aestuarii]|uniref:Secreted protein n=1 Tax=Aporhodopirellula aestuarii TaxID=2950107 RepID=A0ABT0UCS7_9BACT|nr:hypothetical protein [Aporhodopirellula aestuarii]MCM2374096.1 hypothetical protein [Aporhodopirellula aestuarii]
MLSCFHFECSTPHQREKLLVATKRLIPSLGTMRCRHGRTLLLFLSVSILLGTNACVAETWTSLSGDRSIEAEMVGMWDNQVVLLLSSGQRINVPLNSFEATSRIQAGKIAERLEQQRAALTEEIKRVAAAEAAPAPEPIPTPPDAPPYSPPNANMAPDQAFDTIAQQIRNGHLVVVYDALPPKYRRQIDQLAQLTTTKLDPNAITEPLGQLYQLADLIVTRQNWILSHPRLRDPAGDADDLTLAGETFTKLVLPAAGLLQSGLTPDGVSIDTIRSNGFGEWLHERDAAIAPYLAVLLETYSMPKSQWRLLKATEDTAILETEGPVSNNQSPAGSNSRRIELTKVDGFWIPAAVAKGFEDWITQQTEMLTAYDDASMSLSDWIGGSYVSVPTTPTRPQSNPYDDSGYGPDDYDMSQYDEGPDEYMDSYEDDDFGYSGGPGYSSSVKARMIEPPAITPEMIGSILQSVGGFASIAAPLQSATDAASFHQAADQIVGSIEGILAMVSGG